MEENKEKKMSLQEWSMHYRQIIILLVSCLVALGIYHQQKRVPRLHHPSGYRRCRLSWCHCTRDGGASDQTA